MDHMFKSLRTPIGIDIGMTGCRSNVFTALGCSTDTLKDKKPTKPMSFSYPFRSNAKYVLLL